MKKKNIEEIGKVVVEIEASALLKLADNLPTDFSRTIEAVLKTRGRVIVSGIGKSGHVGRKIAATLASTGTPSSFVHATEASHGDLGMITTDDFCLLISNSGETSELNDILTHAKRFGIPTAVISSSKNSSLMQAADFKLALPKCSRSLCYTYGAYNIDNAYNGIRRCISCFTNGKTRF